MDGVSGNSSLAYLGDMRGVPVNAWNEEVCRLLGNCLGRTVLVDSKTPRKEDLEVVR